MNGKEFLNLLKKSGITEEQLKDPAFLKRVKERIDEWYEFTETMVLHGSFKEVALRVDIMRGLLDALEQTKAVCYAYQPNEARFPSREDRI